VITMISSLNGSSNRLKLFSEIELDFVFRNAYNHDMINTKVVMNIKINLKACLIFLFVVLQIPVWIPDIEHKKTVTYQIVAATDGVTHSKNSSSLMWVWSIREEKTNKRQDERVSFSDYSQHKVGDWVTFDRIIHSDYFALLFFSRGILLIGIFILIAVNEI
jgi:hypothetical protein